MPIIFLGIFLLVPPFPSARTFLPDQHLLQPSLVAQVAPNAAQPRQRVENFLSAWLVKKDLRAALRFFSSRALASPVILSEDCAGYIQSKDRGKPSAVRRGVVRFLKEFKNAARGTNLKTILSVERLGRLEELHPLEPTNDFQSDHFLLLKLEKKAALNEIPLWQHNRKTAAFLSRELAPRTAYVGVAVVRVNGGEAAFYFVLGLEQGTWSIVHLDLICA